MFAPLIVGALASSFLVAWLMGFVVRRAALHLGLVDQPGPRKVHRDPTPLGGGLAVYAGVVLPLVFGGLCLVGYDSPAEAEGRGVNWAPELLLTHWAGLRARAIDLAKLLAAGTVMLLLGLADDRRAIDWRLRLAVQFAVAGFVVWGCGWRLTFFFDAPAVTEIVTLLWVVWLVNSFNMLDNMDMLSGGAATIAAAILATVLLIAPESESNGPQLFVAGFLLLLVGALAGFLLHNRPPAKMFLGDGGAYFVGFCLAAATILATFAGGEAPRHAILAPACVLAIPLYDTLSVVAIRLSSGRSPFAADKSHFSHRLVDLGLSKPQAVAVVHLACLTCGLGALLLHQVNLFGAAIVLFMVAGVLALLAILEAAALSGVRQK